MLGHQRTLIVIALIAESWRAMPAASRTALAAAGFTASAILLGGKQQHPTPLLLLPTRQRAADAAASLDDFAEVDDYDGRA